MYVNIPIFSFLFWLISWISVTFLGFPKSEGDLRKVKPSSPSNVGSFRLGEDFLQKDMFPTTNSEFTSLPLELNMGRWKTMEDYFLSFLELFRPVLRGKQVNSLFSL